MIEEIQKILNQYSNDLITEEMAKKKLFDLSIVSDSFLKDIEAIYWKIDNNFCSECDCGYVKDLDKHIMEMELIEDITGFTH